MAYQHKSIFVEEQQWWYLTHSWVGKEFPIIFQHVYHYTMRNTASKESFESLLLDDDDGDYQKIILTEMLPSRFLYIYILAIVEK